VLKLIFAVEIAKCGNFQENRVDMVKFFAKNAEKSGAWR